MTILLGEDWGSASFEMIFSVLHGSWPNPHLRTTCLRTCRGEGDPENMRCAGDDALVINSSCQLPVASRQLPENSVDSLPRRRDAEIVGMFRAFDRRRLRVHHGGHGEHGRPTIANIRQLWTTRRSRRPALQSAGSARVNHNLQTSCARLLSSESWLL